jgi:hypothetical protein
MKLNFVKKNKIIYAETADLFEAHTDQELSALEDVLAQPIVIPESKNVSDSYESKGLKFFCIILLSLFAISLAFLVYFYL